MMRITRRIALVAALGASLGCASRPALPLDGSGTGSDSASRDDASNEADASPCSPYTGGLGFISPSRLPAGACTTAASCTIDTRDDVCGAWRQWRCTCAAGTWACTIVQQDKLDCPPRDAGSNEAGLTAPDADFCCPRDEEMSACMHLGGVDQLGCLEVCDFWCSTNWRVETDKYGCERWEMDYRMPAPGENAQCLPDADGGTGVDVGANAVPHVCPATCGAPSCTGATLATYACGGSTGQCEPTEAPCPNHFACASSGDACATTCTDVSTTGCAPGYECASGSCVPAVVVCDKVACGVANINAECCVSQGGVASDTCIAPDKLCPGNTIQRIFCDSRRDCPAGNVCCAVTDGSSDNVNCFPGPTCPSGGTQMCDPNLTPSECTSGVCTGTGGDRPTFWCQPAGP